MSEVLILGAGPCGLGAALFLKRAGFSDFQVLEAGTEPGGLARSFIDDKGFTWDIGGHVQFSHYQDFDSVMDEALGDAWNIHQRESWVRLGRNWIPYPFQYNLHRLSPEDQKRSWDGLQQRPQAAPSNFEEWIQGGFGSGISDIFMMPYNFKVWAHPAKMMSYQWIGERVAQIDMVRTEKNLREKIDDVSWGPNATFRFPKRGGTGAIWKRVAEMLGESAITYQSTVQSVDLKKKVVTTREGKEFSFSKLLSTLPLDQLMKLSGIKMKADLLHSSSHIVGLGIKGQIPDDLKTKCWIYFPGAESPFYRATVFSNYSESHTPDSKNFWSLMCETAESSFRPVDHQNLIEQTRLGLIATGILKVEDEIVSRWHFRAPYGYPIPSLGRDEVIHDALFHLEEASVFSRGRFGLWKYEVSNQDHTFMQGFEWASHFLNKTAEYTYCRPELVNAPGRREKLPQNWEKV